MKTIKALALLSSGLDSTLAVKLILENGIDVEAINRARVPSAAEVDTLRLP